jgi:hypothetical protein
VPQLCQNGLQFVCVLRCHSLGTQLWYSPFKGKHDVGMLFHE